MAQPLKKSALDIDANEIAVSAPGALYQIVHGDETNDHFKEVMERGAKENRKARDAQEQ